MTLLPCGKLGGKLHAGTSPDVSENIKTMACSTDSLRCVRVYEHSAMIRARDFAADEVGAG